MAPKKKTKTGDTLNSRLALVMKSGKVVLGYKSTLKGKSAEGVSLRISIISRALLLTCSRCSPPLWQGQAGPHCRQHPSSPQV